MRYIWQVSRPTKLRFNTLVDRMRYLEANNLHTEPDGRFTDEFADLQAQVEGLPKFPRQRRPDRDIVQIDVIESVSAFVPS